MICDSRSRLGGAWPALPLRGRGSLDLSPLAAPGAVKVRLPNPVIRAKAHRGDIYSQAAVARRDAGRGIRATTAPSTPVSVAQATSNAGRPAHF